MQVLVIGCGISGLTTGISLLRAGYSVHIKAKDLPPNTTSNIAAAVWYPYNAFPRDRITAWGKIAFRIFQTHATKPETGVLMRSFLEVKPAPVGDPWWLEAVESFRHATPDELPAGYADGYVFETPVIDTSRYLPYLMQVFQQEGGLITRETVTTLGDALTEYPIVINCSGLGARELVGDRDIHAGRGQTIRIKQNGFQRVIVDDEGPNKLAYIVPRTSDIILGGVDEENNENTSIIPEQNSGILQRCANLAPQFANLKPEDILSVQCGLRPLRSRIRLEAERPVPDRLLVHNYGHGGSGVTLSWGCATEVVTLVKQHTA